MAEKKIPNLPSNNLSTPNTPKQTREDMTQPAIDGAHVIPQRKHTFADDVKDISNSLWSEIVLPSLKKGTSDFLGSLINKLLFGSGQQSSNNVWGGQPNSYQNYNLYSQQHGRPTHYAQPQSMSSSLGVNNVIYQTRADADSVLGRMWEVLSKYGWVSVADYHQISNVSTNANNHLYGWTNLEGVQTTSNGQGWFLTLPEPISER